MNRNGCEREAETAEATRAGSWSAKLGGHVQLCAACALMRQVVESLLNHAAELRKEHEPVAASLIWRRAQLRQQEMALKRVTRPLMFMRFLSLGCGIIFAAWLLHGLAPLQYRGLLRSWDGVGVGTAWTGAAVSLLCIATGAWYLLHDGKRTAELDVSDMTS